MEVIRIGGGGFTFERNIIRNGQKYGILISIHPESTVKLTHKNELQHNLIYGHAQEGIYFLDDIDPLEVYNNVIANNNTLGSYPNVYISATTTYSTWKNNILVGNMKMDTPSVILDNNCYYRESGPVITYLGTDYALSEFAAYQAASGQDANSIASDPLFVDEINNDFHLSAGSPCIDAGVDVGLSGDFDGNPLIPPPDIGAFEALPDITVSPANKNFGIVAVSDVSQSQIFTISNGGTTDLVIGNVYLTGTNPYQFSILNDTCASATIAPSGSCTTEARYEPTKTGAMYAEIGIDSNDPDTPTLYIDLTGTGVNTIPPVSDPGGPYTGAEGQAITLDGSGSTDSDGTISLYEWDIDNDGTFDYSSSSPAQSHTYAQQGIYAINLRVTDDLGATDEATTTATVSDTSPTADFTGSPTSGLAPLAVNFNDSSTGYDRPLSYEWDFDNDGLIDSTVQNPSYTYNTAGIYTVSLTATDSDGSANSLTMTDYITACLSPVRIEGAVPVYYSTLQAAYDASIDGDIIQSRAVVFSENLDINLNKPVTFEGGYDCDYATVAGETTINGTMTVSDGTVTVENFVVE
ncbi:MAG TPA: choice-of-anchor D domain-containing protein [Nitrospirae bacterium]|nr:choice-of-anchor D domain-containing protein [Nitrospirota bacterium]